MAYPFHECDDVHDAAADALRVITDRLARRDLRLTAPDALRDLLAAALQLAEVEDQQSPP
jgi:hypothetical protein